MSATPSEEILGRLARKTFLSPWSYSSPYINKKQHGKGHGKEACDFLVVFGDHVVIFSDKHIVFKDNGNLQLEWSRWYRKAVTESFSQIIGVERWIRTDPNAIYADRSCTEPLNLEWPDSPIIHRIIVVRGAAERARKERNGNASLLVTNAVAGGSTPPFHLEQPSESHFCHIFDEMALEVMLDYLDTATDLIEYLQEKERLFSSVRKVTADAEQELLGLYLQNLDDQDRHFIPHDPGKDIVITAGHWDSFRNGIQFAAWQKANEDSYMWDRMTERFFHHQQAGTQYFQDVAGTDMETKKLLYWFAALTRFSRRIMVAKIVEWVEIVSQKENFRGTSVVVPQRPGSPFWGILVLNQPTYAKSYEEFRTKRRNLLELLAYTIKFKYPEAEKIACVAIDSTEKGSSEDALFVDATDWSQELYEQGKLAHDKLGLLKTGKLKPVSFWEYPVDDLFAKGQDRIVMGDKSMMLLIGDEHSPSRADGAERHRVPRPRNKIGRNEVCPLCDSGKKYKYCCLRR